MRVRGIVDKSIWEEFLFGCHDKTFFQSWEWGKFREKVGEKIWRLGIYEDNALVGVALVSRKAAKRGTYLEVAHGPSFAKATEGTPMQKEACRILLQQLKEIVKEEGASFVRINPLWERNDESKRVLRELGFRRAPMYSSYESTWKLDITKSEEDLLLDMRKTTRYLIRQTQKNSDITVRQGLTLENREHFHSLMRDVGERQGFIPFLQQDTEQEIATLQSENHIALFLGLYKKKPVVAALVVFWQGIGFYHQGASLGEYAKYSIPYLVQWEAIQEAKRRGCTLYDFWGFVDPKKYPKHPWAGPTLFKMGFGGKGYEYIKTHDYPVSLKYWPIAAFEKVRAIRRGL